MMMMTMMGFFPKLFKCCKDIFEMANHISNYFLEVMKLWLIAKCGWLIGEMYIYRHNVMQEQIILQPSCTVLW